MQAVSCVSSSVSCRGPATPTTPPSRGPGRQGRARPPVGPHRARGTRFRTHQAPGLAFFPPQVYGDKDADGFYRGETCARLGLIPCNMVSEIQADDDEMMDQLLRQGFLPLNTPVEKAGKRLRAAPGLSQQRRLRARDQAAPPSGATGIGKPSADFPRAKRALRSGPGA